MLAGDVLRAAGEPAVERGSLSITRSWTGVPFKRLLTSSRSVPRASRNLLNRRFITGLLHLRWARTQRMTTPGNPAFPVLSERVRHRDIDRRAIRRPLAAGEQERVAGAHRANTGRPRATQVDPPFGRRRPVPIVERED